MLPGECKFVLAMLEESRLLTESRPEVNIGIACANAPILRPLYLFFQGRLTTQKSGSTSFSKERTWPSNAKAARLESSSPFRHESSDATMSMEMGIPVHNDPDCESPLKKCTVHKGDIDVG